MDPLLAALPETIRIWFAKKGEALSVLHDKQAVVDPPTVDTTLHVLRHPLPEFRRFHGSVVIDEIIQVDSKTDPRVQVADLIAGVGRSLGTAALGSSQVSLDPRSFVARSSLWAHDPSWLVLTGLPSVQS